MWIPAYFSNSGVSTTGLSPTITIYKLSDSSKVIDTASMTEIADGFYKYNFSDRDLAEAYSYICDSVDLSGTEQYALGDIEANDVATLVWDELISSHVTDGTFGYQINSDLKRVLGLLSENIYIDNPDYDNDGNLSTARVRIYSDAVSVGTESNVIGTYETTSEGSGIGRFTYWKQVKD